MSDFSQVEGSWLACDGNWYPPQSLADWRREHLSDSTQSREETSEPIPVPSLAEVDSPGSSTSKVFRLVEFVGPNLDTRSDRDPPAPFWHVIQREHLQE